MVLSRSIRRMLLAATLAGALLCATAPGALAATLTQAADGTVTYTGSDAENTLLLSEPAPGTIRVRRGMGDSDPITSSDCTPITPGTEYECTGVPRFFAGVGGGDDIVNGAGLPAMPMALDGGAGADDLFSGGGDDALTGGAGDDYLSSEGDDDTLDGGDGDDTLVDFGGNDRTQGGPGDDLIVGGTGSDDHAGGTGNDTAATTGHGDPPRDVAVSLNDQADDRMSGTDGEVDNVRSDIEAVDTESAASGAFEGSGNDTLTGSAAPNALRAGAGNDTLDGGDGNDLLAGGTGDDTIRARDGFADFVSCGAGTDTAEVDTLDRVEDCENVQSAEVGNRNDVPEDRPPAIEFTSPQSGAQLGTGAPTVLTATATDDRAVAAVQFVDDERIVCTDTEAPYTCDYRPTGDDVGRNTLVATAIDSAQQTTTAARSVRVGRFDVAAVTASVTPRRDRRAPFRFRSSGRLQLPPGVTEAQGCGDGRVSIQVKAGRKTISTRRARVSGACTFSSTVTFRNRRRFTRNGRLRFTLRFTGNEILNRTSAVARNIRTR